MYRYDAVSVCFCLGCAHEVYVILQASFFPIATREQTHVAASKQAASLIVLLLVYVVVVVVVAVCCAYAELSCAAALSLFANHVSGNGRITTNNKQQYQSIANNNSKQ